VGSVSCCAILRASSARARQCSGSSSRDEAITRCPTPQLVFCTARACRAHAQ
jgi:hypothetical protein